MFPRTLSPVTVNMVRKANNSRDLNVRQRYLKALGVTDVSLYTLPASIDPKYAGEWKAFMDANSDRHADPEEHAILTFLSFLRYCRMVKLNPFVKGYKYKDPLTSSPRLDPVQVQKKLVENGLKLINNAVSTYVKKTRIGQYMNLVGKRVVPVTAQGIDRLCATYVFAPMNKRLTLDNVLANVKGSLYTSDLPPQFRAQKKTVGKKTVDARPSAETLIGSQSTLGWEPLLKTAAFVILATRAKDDRLLIRVYVTAGRHRNSRTDVSLKDRALMWAKLGI